MKKLTLISLSLLIISSVRINDSTEDDTVKVTDDIEKVTIQTKDTTKVIDRFGKVTAIPVSPDSTKILLKYYTPCDSGWCLRKKYKYTQG